MFNEALTVYNQVLHYFTFTHHSKKILKVGAVGIFNSRNLFRMWEIVFENSRRLTRQLNIHPDHKFSKVLTRCLSHHRFWLNTVQCGSQLHGIWVVQIKMRHQYQIASRLEDWCFKKGKHKLDMVVLACHSSPQVGWPVLKHQLKIKPPEQRTHAIRRKKRQ